MTTTRPTPPPHTWDFLLTTLFVFIELLLVVVLLLSAFTFGTLNQGCTAAAGCSQLRIQVGQQLCTFGPPAIALITIPWAIVRVSRRKIGFWLAALGAVGMVGVFFIGSTLMQSGIPA
jgi:hypothetical protein